MDIVAQVFDWKITQTELEFEENKLRNLYPDAAENDLHANALKQLIDRYLLMREALNKGFQIDEDEFDNAFLELIDDMESSDASLLMSDNGRGEQIDMIVKSNLLIRKFISSLDEIYDTISDAKLRLFYEERKDFFYRDEEVRASHILIKGELPEAKEKIAKIRSFIKSANDFARLSNTNSDCPSGVNCGDLGFFPRGRMIPEIDDVAFNLQINEISQPFASKYGYHILMVTDRKEKRTIPFEKIKDSLKQSLKNIEHEITYARIVNELRERCHDSIKIFDNAFQ
jgi:parvulin-like peptidyl-prolyl isomerase